MTRSTPIADWTHYRQAVVRLRTARGMLAVRACPGVVSGDFPDPRRRTVHLVTACNPAGRTASPAANAHAQAVLLAELDRQGLAWWPAEGGDAHRRHVEPSAAIAGLDDDAARELGRRHGQDAIFAWDPAAWRLLSCADDRAETHGWTATVYQGFHGESGIAVRGADGAFH
jgi:Protein of unknown function (DUF3293)